MHGVILEIVSQCLVWFSPVIDWNAHLHQPSLSASSVECRLHIKVMELI